MVNLKDDEVRSVLESCTEQIDKLVVEYKTLRKLSEFDPVVKVFPIGVMGFNAFLYDVCDVPLASVTYFEGCVVFTTFEIEKDVLH